MFTHLVILNKKPWFIYAAEEEDALTICEKFRENVVGVVVAPEGLIMKELHQKLSLSSPDIRLINHIVDNENQKLAQEVLDEGEENDQTNSEIPRLVSKET